MVKSSMMTTKIRRKKQSSIESFKDNGCSETEVPDIGSSMPNIGASVAVSSDVGGGGVNVSSLFDETVRREPAVSTENVERLGDAANHSDYYSVSGSHGVRHHICAIPRINTTRSMDEQSMERKRSLPSRCYVNGCTVNCHLNNDIRNKNSPFKSPTMTGIGNNGAYCEHVAGNGSAGASNSKRRRTLSNDKLLSNGGLHMIARTALDDKFSPKTARAFLLYG
uniref:Uncharacterized protein n=1 Tax=Romanomermis culicivorax TaxID=13658 RepID=A0A915KAA8_ROMCU